MAVLIAEIILALFAVFGLYAAVRLLVFCGDDREELFVAVKLSPTMPPAAWQRTVAAAKERAALFGGRRVAVLLEGTLAENRQLTLFLESECLAYYCIRKEE